MLATYRKHCANPSMPGQLILPECLKLLPLFVNCVLKCDAISGNSELTPDDRSWLMFSVMTMGVRASVHYFYPKLIPIAGPNANLDNPVPLRCSQEKLREDSAYVLGKSSDRNYFFYCALRFIVIAYNNLFHLVRQWNLHFYVDRISG